MFASFNDVFKGKSLREKKVPDVTLKYLSNNLPKGVKYVSDEHGNLTITSSDGSAVTFGGFNVTAILCFASDSDMNEYVKENPDCYENILSKAKFPQDYLE